MKAKVSRIKLDQNKRILIVSDIHGGLDVFKRLLQRVNFCKDDYLFILGDLIERGPKSIETIRYVLSLVEEGNTFVLKGNNDTIVDDILENTFDRNFYNFVLPRGSIYLEMCNQLGIEINDDTNFKKINPILYSHYKKEINFVYDLPQIIETDRFIFAHAGIDNFGSLEENDAWRVMRQDTFVNFAAISPKLTFVGHYPCVVYSYHNADYAPKRNFQKRIISIDGGYAVKDEGHINLIIVDSESNINIDYIYEDDLRSVNVVASQIGNNDYDLLIWGRDKFEVIEEKGEEYVCRLENGKTIDIPKIFIYKDRDKWYCMDYTNRILDLDKNDKVKLVKCYKNLALVKKDTVIGWAYIENLDI